MSKSGPSSTDASRTHATTSRGGFSSSLGVLAATLGSAVGLGNIWKFPSLTGANGGAGFLLIYLLSTLFIGLPLMVAEIAIGRQARANPISALRQLQPRGAPWWLIGVAGMAAAFLIMAFYSEVVAWVFAYVAKALSGNLLSSDPVQTQASFDAWCGTRCRRCCGSGWCWPSSAASCCWASPAASRRPPNG